MLLIFCHHLLSCFFFCLLLQNCLNIKNRFSVCFAVFYSLFYVFYSLFYVFVSLSLQFNIDCDYSRQFNQLSQRSFVFFVHFESFPSCLKGFWKKFLNSNWLKCFKILFFFFNILFKCPLLLLIFLLRKSSWTIQFREKKERTFVVKYYFEINSKQITNKQNEVNLQTRNSIL